MIEQRGRPHVWATHSYADLFDPVLHEFIKEWVVKSGQWRAEYDPFAPGLSLSDARRCARSCSSHTASVQELTISHVHRRKVRNVVEFPNIVAEYFHRKTQLFISHIAVESLGADAYWAR